MLLDLRVTDIDEELTESAGCLHVRLQNSQIKLTGNPRVDLVTQMGPKTRLFVSAGAKTVCGVETTPRNQLEVASRVNVDIAIRVAPRNSIGVSLQPKVATSVEVSPKTVQDVTPSTRTEVDLEIVPCTKSS